MKQVMNFRLNQQAVSILLTLKKTTGASHTQIIEEALLCYAKKNLSAQHPLASLSGKLSEKDAKKMLFSIKTNRHNKKDEPIL